jgi:hypothetical protein
MATVMVAALATAAAATPALVSAPVLEVMARVVFTVVVILASGDLRNRLGAGVLPGLRKGPTPIDKPVELF